MTSSATEKSYRTAIAPTVTDPTAVPRSKPTFQIELASPILSDAELESIVRSGDPRFFSHHEPLLMNVR